MAVWFAPRLSRESYFRIYFHYIRQRRDFLACRVVESARRLKIRSIARRAPSATGLAEGNILPRPHGNGVEQASVRDGAIYKLLQTHSQREQCHERSHSDGNAESSKRISEDGLAQVHYYRTAATEENAAMTAAERSLELSLTQYREGAVSYLDVVTSQTVTLQTQLESLNLDTTELRASVQLIRALGGGWTSAQVSSS